MPAPISKAQVMRNAWKTYRFLIARGQGKPGRALFRAALRRAWADAKQNVTMMEIIRSLPKPQSQPSVDRRYPGFHIKTFLSINRFGD